MFNFNVLGFFSIVTVLVSQGLYASSMVDGLTMSYQKYRVKH